MKRGAMVLASGIAAATVLGAASERGAQAAFPGRSGRVAVQVTPAGGSELSPAAIALVYPDDRDAVVTVSPRDGSHNANPAWSPAGDRLAFNSNSGGLSEADFNLFVVREDGSALHQVTFAPGSQADPAWSPRGEAIAYASDETGDSEIWAVEPDGGTPRRLTTSAGFDGEPAWSPDGSLIAFTSRRDGNQELYLMNADGSSPRRLTASPGSDRHPTWSPDGRSIAFDSDRSGNFEIYSTAVDGSNVRRLTSDPALDARPAWSPTGDSIAFQSDRQTRGGRHVWAVRATGGAAVQLTAGAAWVTSPDWQPVQFESACTIKGTIYGESLDGTRHADTVCGLAGDDFLSGDEGADRIRGGAGNDRIFDYGGKDRLEGGSGNDVISARDGRRDVVVGGPGRDSARVDRIDRVIGVEEVTRR
jgi:Tol biopolymer transport system component